MGTARLRATQQGPACGLLTILAEEGRMLYLLWIAAGTIGGIVLSVLAGVLWGVILLVSEMVQDK